MREHGPSEDLGSARTCAETSPGRRSPFAEGGRERPPQAVVMIIRHDRVCKHVRRSLAWGRCKMNDNEPRFCVT